MCAARGTVMNIAAGRAAMRGPAAGAMCAGGMGAAAMPTARVMSAAMMPAAAPVVPAPAMMPTTAVAATMTAAPVTSASACKCGLRHNRSSQKRQTESQGAQLHERPREIRDEHLIPLHFTLD